MHYFINNRVGAQALAPQNLNNMIRQSLLDLLLVCRKIKTAYQVPSYELHDYDDYGYAEFRVGKITSIKLLADLSEGFEVSIFAESDATIIRIYENYQGD